MEGPSIRLIAEELQPFVNKKIKKISGNAHFEKEALLNQRIKEIFSFGKRLIIQLDDCAIITHFLMYGSYRVNEDRPNMAPRLSIEVTHYKFNFYNCSSKLLPKVKVRSLIPFEYDILSPAWDMKKVIKALKKKPKQTIDDALLDQDIFPGVGNIIKNEVLFLSKTSPYIKVGDLTDKKIVEIAQHARAFSQRFFDWRKKFQLKKNLLVYRKKNCPACGTKIMQKKTGMRVRWSFVCPQCQNIEL